MQKNSYHTRQKEKLEDFLSRSPDRQLTMSEIVDGVSACGVGRSTVYRLVAHMVEEGSLRRFRGKDAKAVLYQYIGNNSACNSHFHLKCTCCGRIIHLDCRNAEEFQHHILKDHGFAIDVSKCVLYGLCHDCLEKEEGENK